MEHYLRLGGAWLVPALMLLAVLAAGVNFARRFEGCFGVALAVIAGLMVVLGLLLFYQLSVDWLNGRYVSKYVVDGALPEDGSVIAIEGKAEVEGEPMTAPFSGTKCAAYVYKVSKGVRERRSEGPDRTRQVVIARGFHMKPTTISGPTLSLTLGSLPSFEEGMREEESERRWGAEWNGLVERAPETSRDPDSAALEAELLKLQQTQIREIHQDYVSGQKISEEQSAGSLLREEAAKRPLDGEQQEKMDRLAATLDSASGDLTIHEEVLPIGETVCLIGRYDAESRSIDGLGSRIGPNLKVYRGTGREVVEKIAGEIRKGLIASIVMILLGIAVLSVPFWPAPIMAKIPGVELSQ